MYFCLPTITNPMYIVWLREMVPPPSQNTVGICNQITLLVFYYVSFRLGTLLKITDAPIQVSDIFYLALSFRFISFGFQTFLLFVPEMSTCFTSYIVQIILHCLVTFLKWNVLDVIQMFFILTMFVIVDWEKCFENKLYVCLYSVFIQHFIKPPAWALSFSWLSSDI